MSCPSLLNGDANVPKLTSAKSLGEHIDDALTRSAHIEKTSKKLTSAIGALQRLRQFVPSNHVQLFYPTVLC